MVRQGNIVAASNESVSHIRFETIDFVSDVCVAPLDGRRLESCPLLSLHRER